MPNVPYASRSDVLTWQRIRWKRPVDRENVQDGVTIRTIHLALAHIEIERESPGRFWALTFTAEYWQDTYAY